MKRIIAMSLVALIALTAFGGCSKESSGTTPTPSASSSPGSPVSDEYADMLGWERPDELITIAYFGGNDDADALKKNSPEIQAWLEEHFNIRFEKWVTEDDAGERINLMLSSNDYPDVCEYLGYSNANKFVTAKKAIDVTSLTEEYAPSLIERMGDYWDMIANSEGKRYFLYNWHGMSTGIENSVNIRYDWWLEAGSPSVETTDQLYEVLKAISEKHPTNEDGQKVYALSDCDYTVYYQVYNLMYGLLGGYYEATEDNKLIHWTQSDKALDAALFANKLYREGLMDPDYFTNSYDDVMAKAANGRVIGNIGYYWLFDEAVASIKKGAGDAYDENTRYVPFDSHPSYLERSSFSGKNALGGYYTVITDKSKNLETLFKWFEFENTDMGSKLAWWGIPNTELSYWVTDGKTWSFTDTAKNAVLEENNSLLDQMTAASGPNIFNFTTPQVNTNDNTVLSIAENFSDQNKWSQLTMNNMKNSIYDATSFWTATVRDNSEWTEKNTAVNEIVNKYWPLAVTADTKEECEAIFMDMRQKCINAGVEYVQDVKTTVYQNNIQAIGH